MTNKSLFCFLVIRSRALADCCELLLRFSGQSTVSLSGQPNFLTLEMETNAPLAQAKLVLLGDMGAGKSSLVLRFVK